MVKKKKRKPLKPFCWYCDQIFKDESVLVQHQKAKHFKCMTCNKKLSTVIALAEHALQMHQVTLQKVPNAIKGRDSLELDIYGMENVPEADKEAMKRKQNGQEPLEELERPAKKAKLEEGGPAQQAPQMQAQYPVGVPPPFQKHASPYMQPGAGQMMGGAPPALSPYGMVQQPWNAYGQPPRPGMGPAGVPPPFGNRPMFPGQHPHGTHYGQMGGQMGRAGGMGPGPTLSSRPVAASGAATFGFGNALQGTPTAQPQATGASTAPTSQQVPAPAAAFAAGALPGQAVQQAPPQAMRPTPEHTTQPTSQPTTQSTIQSTTQSTTQPTTQQDTAKKAVTGTNYYYGDNDVSAEEKRAILPKYKIAA